MLEAEEEASQIVSAGKATARKVLMDARRRESEDSLKRKDALEREIKEMRLEREKTQKDAVESRLAELSRSNKKRLEEFCSRIRGTEDGVLSILAGTGTPDLK